MDKSFERRAIADTFSAWINKMPGAGNRLQVKGEAGGGWSVDLVPAVSQDINPTILILELAETRDGIQTKRSRAFR